MTEIAVAAVRANDVVPISPPPSAAAAVTPPRMPNAPRPRPTNVSTAATAAALQAPKRKQAPEHLRVLTLNIQLDAKGGKTIGGIVDIIRASRADVVGMQEVGDSGPEIARQLGFNYVKVGDDTAVISRYALAAPGDGKHIVTITTKSGRNVQFMDLHLPYTPYQPYQLLKIPYDSGRFIDTEAEAIDEAWRARGVAVTEALTELSAAKTDAPQIVVGDFNQPSYLDWTARAAKIHRHPIKVAWPETKAFADAGFADAYREVYPNEIRHSGETWTPTTSPHDPKDHHDRLDFVLHNGQIRPRHAEVVGENRRTADIAVKGYATDHRGVVVDFTL